MRTPKATAWLAESRERIEVALANVLATRRVGSRGFRTPGMQWQDAAGWLPSRAFDDNFLRVADALDAARVRWWIVSGLRPGVHVIGVDESDRRQVYLALARSVATAEAYACDPRRPTACVHALRVPNFAAFKRARLLQVGVPRRWKGLWYGLDHGCEIEFWRRQGQQHIGPRENRAAKELSADDMAFVQIEVAGRTADIPAVFTRRMLDDVTFDIDVVYTWVDDADPAWRETRDRALAAESGEVYHPSATDDARFRSQDELRYSLRSLAMYAPWVRHVYLVTNGQVPSWLRRDHPGLTVVPHSAIFDDPADLPTFNSNAIISQLHHIAGLSEHYLFLNDDVFLGDRVEPSDFFTPNGFARVFPSNARRAFGRATPDDETHQNLTRNIRTLLEQEFGVTVSRAILHTPHPQLRSLHDELEARFATAYRQTVSHRFRHHSDVVGDQMHHYYAQIVGRGVPSRIRYSYIQLNHDAVARLKELATKRDRQTFCLNDVPRETDKPIPSGYVRNWLEEFFPVASEFEL